MFDALSIFHLKVRRLAFQVLPVLRSLQLSLGIQLSGGQQRFWKYHQSTQQSAFSSLALPKRPNPNAGGMSGQNKGISCKVQKE